MLTKIQATKKGEKLLRLVKDTIGGDWKVDVWDNLGWHYVVYLGAMVIWEYENYPSTYHATIADELIEEMKYRPVGTPCNWSVDAKFATPKEALSFALDKVQKIVDRELKVLNQNKNLLP